MACYSSFSLIFIFSILLAIPLIESSRCSKKCTFPELKLNSSISSDFCASSNESNDDINQICQTKLTIDFTTGYVSGSFDVRNQSSSPPNNLDITTVFALNDTSIKVNIIYLCSMSDYCDLEFVRETLSSALAEVQVQVESVRQKLAVSLYKSNNTDPLKCSNNSGCSENTSLCYSSYIHSNWIYAGKDSVESGCADFYEMPELNWIQNYAPYQPQGPENSGIYFCNNPNCSSNATIIETFQWLAREYILPVNVSIVNVTTTPKPTIITSTITTSTLSTTTRNNASFLFGHFNYFTSFLIIILVLQRSLFQMF